MTSNWFAIRWQVPEEGEFTADYWYTGEGEEQEGMTRQEFIDYCVTVGREQGFILLHAPSPECVAENEESEG